MRKVAPGQGAAGAKHRRSPSVLLLVQKVIRAFVPTLPSSSSAPPLFQPPPAAAVAASQEERASGSAALLLLLHHWHSSRPDG